jgi:hypothetical protein
MTSPFSRRIPAVGFLVIGALTMKACSNGVPVAPLSEEDRALGPSVIWGTNDGDDHPWVGLAFFDDDPSTDIGWICSGSFLTPTVFLTAGHCTDGAVLTIVYGGNPLAWGRFGTSFTHPDFGTSFPNTSDVGIVVLGTPAPLTSFGALPEIEALEPYSMMRGTQDQIFEIVGYGHSGRFPFTGLAPDLPRTQGETRLIELTSIWTGGWNMRLTSNFGRPHQGGACYGDSGGPAILPGTENVVAGVASFVMNKKCVGASAYYRVDSEHAQDFIGLFLP